ncbi:MAG: hypothetical protein WC119_00260 [Synergistaceae bacterium]
MVEKFNKKELDLPWAKSEEIDRHIYSEKYGLVIHCCHRNFSDFILEAVNNYHDLMALKEEYESAKEFVLDDKCSESEQHCGCVSVLRPETKKLEKENKDLKDRVKNLLKFRISVSDEYRKKAQRCFNEECPHYNVNIPTFCDSLSIKQMRKCTKLRAEESEVDNG